MPLLGMVGYSSVTFTRSKKRKALSSGIFIFVYGILLSVVAQVAKFGLAGEFFSVIFAPLAHEGVLIFLR